MSCKRINKTNEMVITSQIYLLKHKISVQQITSLCSFIQNSLSLFLCFFLISWPWAFTLSVKPTRFSHYFNQPIMSFPSNFKSVLLSAPIISVRKWPSSAILFIPLQPPPVLVRNYGNIMMSQWWQRLIFLIFIVHIEIVVVHSVSCYLNIYVRLLTEIWRETLSIFHYDKICPPLHPSGFLKKNIPCT